MRRRREYEKIALERIEILMNLADKTYKDSPGYAQRYLDIARKIGMKTNVGIPKKWRFRMCKHCKKFLIFGQNSKVRLSKSKVVVKCLNCNRYFRIPYINEIKNKRKTKMERVRL